MSFQEAVEKLFHEIDTDHSGKINSNELKKILEAQCGTKLKKSDVDAFLAKLDVNKDGELSLDELAAIF